LYAVHAFLQQVRAVEAGPLQAVLKKMFLLFCLNRVANDASTHLADGWMNEKQLELLQEKVRQLLSEIRKDAVPLVDSFNLPDSLVNSPLGRFDGDLYKHYFAEVRAAPNAEIKVHTCQHQQSRPTAMMFLTICSSFLHAGSLLGRAGQALPEEGPLKPDTLKYLYQGNSAVNTIVRCPPRRSVVGDCGVPIFPLRREISCVRRTLLGNSVLPIGGEGVRKFVLVSLPSRSCSRLPSSARLCRLFCLSAPPPQ
jgi:hypothetical protein